MKKIIYCLFLSLLISCVKNDEAPSFGVSELVFAGDVVNTSQTTKVSAMGEWTIDDASIPAWFSVSPLSGLDNTDITVTVLAVNDTGADRSAEVTLNVVGFQSVYLNVTQQSATQDQLTDGVLSKTSEGYYLKGEPSFVFDPATMQIGVVPSTKNYFLISDDQKQVMSLTFGTDPVLNQASYVSMQSRGIEPALSGTLECQLYKQQDGKLWFYNTTEKRGFIIREIK